MANQKRKVSHADFLQCYDYFKRSLQDNRCLQKDDEGIQAQATQEFSHILRECSETSLEALQSWIDTYIDSATWSRCYKTLNQKKYLAKRPHQTIGLDDQAFQMLKKYASEWDMSYSQAIIDLINKNDSPVNYTTVAPTQDTKKDTQHCIESPPLKSNVVALFPDTEELDAELDSEEIEEDWDVFNHFNREQPRKPDNYDFRKNDSYKKYRERIKKLTIKEIDEDLLSRFDKRFTLNYYLRPDTAHRIGEDILLLRSQLLEEGYFSSQFLPDELAMTQAFTLPQSLLNAYADDLMYNMGEIFGCRCIDITAGNRKPSVFIGNKNHVQIANKMFHYLSAFLSEEMDNFLKKCHKNTKKKNRTLKASWHCSDLMSTMFNAIFEEEDKYQYYSEEEEKALGSYIFSRYGLYCDENEPIGGWYKEHKNKNRTDDFFLW
ncbi:hypothetical protein SC040_15425 [Legionella pneumophila]